jgi:AraC family transcriptional regulator, exoenzyme S synthesis regulatory protein ExsA
LFNFHGQILANPASFRQFSCRDSLITLYNCPLENKYEDVWSQHNYLIYVMEGRKTWHTAHGSYELRKGSCMFVRKGACIVEQFFDAAFCMILFFLPDEFISDVIKSKATPIHKPGKKYEPLIAIDNNLSVQAFFQSMISYFDSNRDPDESLLELKFKELILTLADNPANSELLSYFGSLVTQPQAVSLKNTMEDNYCFNLKLEQFAQLSNRSLSAFKRDFQKQYNTTPGKWLLEKRLNHAMHLLTNAGKTVSEASYESGFENQFHFSRAFRQRFGVAPASMKQKITG